MRYIGHFLLLLLKWDVDWHAGHFRDSGTSEKETSGGTWGLSLKVIGEEGDKYGIFSDILTRSELVSPTETFSKSNILFFS